MDKNIKSYSVGGLNNSTIKSGFTGWRNIGTGSVGKSSGFPIPQKMTNVVIESVDVSNNIYENKEETNINLNNPNPDIPNTDTPPEKKGNEVGVKWLYYLASGLLASGLGSSFVPGTLMLSKEKGAKEFEEGFWEKFLTSGGNTPTQTFVSWFGVENEAGAKWLNFLSDSLQGGVGGTNKEYTKKKAEGWEINKKIKQGKWTGKYYGNYDNIKKSELKTTEWSEKIENRLNKNKDPLKGDKLVHRDSEYSFLGKDKMAAVNLVTIKASASASLAKGSIGVSGVCGYGKLEFKAGYAEANASLNIGPTHAVLEVGAAVGVFKGTASGKIAPLNKVLGYEVFAVEGKGEVTALEASAKAKAGVGWYRDEQGKLHTDLGVQVKAEAILVKAEGTASVDVLGMKGSITGAVKIGAGAKFDIGYVDGKLKFNVGVAVGIGFEVGGSIDPSGVVGKLFDAAQTASNTEGGFFAKAGSFFGSLFNSYKVDTTQQTTTNKDLSFLNTSASFGSASVSGSTSLDGNRTVTKTDLNGNSSTTVNGQPTG